MESDPARDPGRFSHSGAEAGAPGGGGVFLAAILVVAEVCAVEGVFAYAAARLAGRHGSRATLLPVSNLTNLLAVPFLSVGFVKFGLVMAPVCLVVVALGTRGFDSSSAVTSPPVFPRSRRHRSRIPHGLRWRR